MFYIGLDIGGTKCAASLGYICDEDIKICDKDYFSTADKSPYKILQRFSLFIKKHLSKDIQGIGISCGGPLDSDSGIIMSPPSLPLWKDIKIVEYFENEFGIRTYLQNDANACAVAEWKYGAGQGSNNMVFLTFGTGFGAGLIFNGKLYSGANGNAGEIGHVRLTKNGPIGYRKKGSCEGYCSGSGIVRLCEIMREKESLNQSYRDFVNAVGEENISAKTIAEYARKNNRFCKEIFKKSGEMLGRTLSMIVDMLNPEKIIIGGIFMRANDLFTPYVSKTMKKECLSFSLDICEILPAKLSENIGDIAALSIAKGDF